MSPTSSLDRPAISVLLPIRDAQRTLGSCLRSLHRQTCEDFEIVAVDDGSTDGTAALLDLWRRRDRRLRVVRTGPRGLVSALNLGLEHCRAPLVARMDADDAMLPKRLAKQIGLLNDRPQLGVVSCGVRCFPRYRIAGGFRTYEDWLNGIVTPDEHVAWRFVESPVAHPTVVYRRRLVRCVGGYRDAPSGRSDEPWPEDYDLWLRLFERGVPFAKVPEVLHLWRDRADRLTRTDPRYGRDRFMACKAHFLTQGPLAETPRTVIWGAGQTGKRLAKALMHQAHRPVAFVDVDPKKFGREPYGIPVLDAKELGELLHPGTAVLVAVSQRGARQLIRPKLAAAGLVEGESAYFVA